MSIVESALRHAADERDAFVRSSCAQDDALYAEVSEILSGEARMGEFLKRPVAVLTETTPPFANGEVIAQRFEILREIGEGGMGVVYEAFDRKRRQRIAIKAAKSGYQRLLTPELEAALTVRHPNICRANEIHTASTDQGDIDFLTLELLHGETLLARLNSGVAISDADAHEIADQICHALAEAHRCGVIHRDLKSANIFLCKDGEKLRAVITDFGLAGDASRAEGLAGTPEYMAPELWNGAPASVASDIYALGVVLQEVATNRVATADTPIELEGRWRKVIAPCLREAPRDRPANVSAVLSALHQRPMPWWPAAAAVVLLAVPFATPQFREWLWPPPAVRIAVLPAVTSGKLADMGSGIVQDVTDRIERLGAGSRAIAVISPNQAHDLQVSTPEQARTILHATHALQTRLSEDGTELIVDVSVIDLNTRVPVGNLAARYSTENAGSIPVAMSGTVSLALRVRGAAPGDQLADAAVPAYDQGLHFLRQDDASFATAVPLFLKAAEIDPRSALPWAALAEAKIQQYRADRQHSALDEARKYLTTAESLNPDSVSVRLVAGLVHRTLGQYTEALKDYSRVQELEPRNVDAYLRIASVYGELEEPAKAVAHYQEAIALQPDYYRPYQELGVFYYFRSEYANAIEQLRKAVLRAPGLYDTYAYLGAALNYVGQDAQAERAFQTSLSIKETPRALNGLGALQAYLGKDAEAARYYERALARSPNNMIYLLNLGDACRRSGRSDDAHNAYARGLDLALAALNDEARDGLTRSYVAYFAARLGDEKRAHEEINQAMDLSPGNSMVVRKAVLTYIALDETDHAIEVLQRARPDVVRELDRHPDMADIHKDLRFQKLRAAINTQGP